MSTSDIAMRRCDTGDAFCLALYSGGPTGLWERRRSCAAHAVVARDFVDVCELLIVDPGILDLDDGSRPGAPMTTMPLVIDNQFHARAVVGETSRRGRLRARGRLVLEVDALDRGPQPRTELRLCAVPQRPSLRSLLSGGRSRRIGTLVHSSVQQIARSIDRALNASPRPEPFWRHPVEQWIEELRAGDQQHNS